jgi:hypothetical protein
MSTSQALVKDLEGEVSVTRNGEVVNIKVGDYLLPGDEVVTGDTGRLGLEFPGVEGQEPAAGVMTPNGKIVLGEQDSPNGPQMLVMEETECFEFTTELTELSSVAQDSGASGLFGGLAGSGGLLTSALGALATGLFVGGGSSNDSNEEVPAPSNDGGFGFSGGQSQAALAPVIGEDSPIAETVSAAVGPSTPVGQAVAPVATPIADVINEIVTTVNGSPLGVVTQPVTDVALGLISGTVLGSGSESDAGAGASTPNPNVTPSDPGPDHIVQAVQETVAGLQENPGETSPEGTAQNLVEAVQQDVTELVTAGGTNPVSGLVDTVVEGVNQTPLGEPLSPVTEAVQTLADTFDLNSLINAGGEAGLGEGLVTTVVDTVGGALEPVTAQVEPLAAVVDTLHDTAVTVDSVLADTLGSVEGLFSGADLLGAGAGGISPETLSPETLADSLSALPETLEEATGGLLGTVESLTAQLQSGGAEDPTGGLLDTAVSTISSTAADPASSDLSSAVNNLLNGLG